MTLKSETTPTGAIPIEELTYEQAFAELETIVTSLESDDQPLAEALAQYARGQALARFCADLLENAELKVSELADGSPDEFE